MAVYFTEGVGFERAVQYAQATLLGRKLLLEQMNAYPRSAADWDFFYAKSALTMQYLYTQRRAEFYRLWDLAPRKGGRFDVALAASMGLTRQDLGARWTATSRPARAGRYCWPPRLSSGAACPCAAGWLAA
jgi:hypothetical protein